MNVLSSWGDDFPNLGSAQTLVDELARLAMRASHNVTVLMRSRHGFDRLYQTLCPESSISQAQVEA